MRLLQDISFQFGVDTWQVMIVLVIMLVAGMILLIGKYLNYNIK